MFDWDGFENRKFCVEFKNDADKTEFLNECEKRGYVGCYSGCRPTEMTNINCFRRSSYDNGNLKGLATDIVNAPLVIYTPHEIDCSLAVNYITELERMCNETYEPMNKCNHCPIDKASASNDCGYWIVSNPQKAIEIVQAWSDEHQREKVVTLQDKFLELFPNADKTENGIIKMNPCTIIGASINGCKVTCADCRNKFWSQPYKENTNV